MQNICKISLKNAFGNPKIIEEKKKFEKEMLEEELKTKAPIVYAFETNVIEVEYGIQCPNCQKKHWINEEVVDFDGYYKCPDCEKFLKLNE